MTQHRDASAHEKPMLVPLLGVALGVAMFLTSWLLAGAPGIGLVMLVIMLGYAGVMRFGQRSESIQILSNDPPLDERHALIQLHALRAAYFAVLSVSLIGFFWEIARGTPGAFTLIAAVGGATHLLATAVLRRRL